MSYRSGIVINFPVKPHVLKYLHYKVGEKLVVSKLDFFGSMVLDILSKNYSEFQSVPDNLLYPVEISMQYISKMGIYVDSKSIRKFNQRVDSIFREEMRTYIAVNFKANAIAKETSLNQFLFQFDINEDDIKFETLKKDFQRNLK